jgi:lipid A 3-O-deacylase
VIKSRLLTALAGAVLFGTAAQAQSVSLDAPDSARLVLGAGGYDIIGDNSHPAGIFRAEYDFNAKLFWLRPMIGVEGTTDSSVYAYGGFGLDIYFGNNWVLTPNAAVGFWSRGDKDAENLGSWFEFRTGAELDYRFADYSRIGASFHHISNAGLTQRNPGEEEVLATYSIPLGGP